MKAGGATPDGSALEIDGKSVANKWLVIRGVIFPRSPFLFFFYLSHQPFHFTLAAKHPVDLFIFQLT